MIGYWKFFEQRGNVRRRKVGALKEQKGIERTKIWLYVTESLHNFYNHIFIKLEITMLSDSQKLVSGEDKRN